MSHISRFILGCLLATANVVYAADVIKTKGRSVLVDLKGEAASVGDQYYTLNSSGKKSGLIVIRKITGDKAIGRLARGKANVGMTLSDKVKVSAGSKPNSRPLRTQSKTPHHWGVLGGYSMDSMKVKVLWQSADAATGRAKGDQKEVASLTGTGYSAKGLFDYDMGSFTVRALSGIETYNASGVSSCGTGNNQVCITEIVYLTADAMARYIFMKEKFRPWAGLGLSLLFPVSASGTALDPASVGSTWMGILGGGLDYHVSPRLYIPISLEYGLFPPSDQVDATWIQVRIGFAVPY